MSRQYSTKINYLLRNIPKGAVILQSWLETIDISRQLTAKYCLNQWLDKIDHGIYKIKDDKVEWQGAVYALQTEKKVDIHIGALTALQLHGNSHYLNFGKEDIFILSYNKNYKRLPKWINQFFDENTSILFFNTQFIKNRYKNLNSYNNGNFNINISSPEQAILECLDLAPQHISLENCLLLMEGLVTLRPSILQQLLENCSSIKVKRLFMLFAIHLNHKWVKRLDQSKINFGKGKRKIGIEAKKLYTYYPNYQLSIALNLKEKNGEF